MEGAGLYGGSLAAKWNCSHSWGRHYIHVHSFILYLMSTLVKATDMDLVYTNIYLTEQLIQRLTRYTKLKSFIPGHRNFLKNNKDKDAFSLE